MTALAVLNPVLERVSDVKRVDFTGQHASPLTDMFSMRLSKEQGELVDAEVARLSETVHGGVAGRPGLIRHALQFWFDSKEIDPYAEALGVTKESMVMVAFFYWLEHSVQAKPLRDKPPIVGVVAPTKLQTLPETVEVKKPRGGR